MYTTQITDSNIELFELPNYKTGCKYAVTSPSFHGQVNDHQLII